jgi:S-methylmethionine-dependent homocysteine/selenocysteine methylase
MPIGWRGRDGSPLPGARTDMGIDPYTRAVMQWVDMGAEVVGGCCEIGPDHIARIRQVLDA